MKTMSICEANTAISAEARDFLINVPDAKEESVTDYLVWKWRELDSRFKYINISTFTRHEENTVTGADFELELWLVGRRFHFPLVFQAKKFVKPHDSYVGKLNYPDGTQGQLGKLLTYAKARKRLPFYAFYSVPDEKTKTMCRNRDHQNTGIFMADAITIKAFADGAHGKKISKNRILSATNPFHCMFCCPLGESGSYFKKYFSSVADIAEPIENEKLPNYINLLLSGRILEMSKQEILSIINQQELRSFRAIGVYDMREDVGSNNPF